MAETTWIGSIYRKFEQVRTDIDNIMSLESFEYAHNQLLKAGEDVKEFCDGFMQEILPDFCNDSLQDEDHTNGISNCNSSSGQLCGGKCTCGKKMGLAEDPVVKASKREDLGMTSSFEVSQPLDDGFDGHVNLPSPISVECQSSLSSAKAAETGKVADAKVNDLTVLQSVNSVISAGFDKRKFLDNEVSSSCSASETSNDSTDDNQAGQTKDDFGSATGMKVIEPLNIDDSCFMVDISCASDLLSEHPASQVEKEWECLQAAGFEDHTAESDQPRRKKCLPQVLHTEESESGDEDFCGSDWEII